ncbi:MAG: hypothetical protein ACTHMC_24115 [Pseudobacter sp.]|uniref:hypothetical protein n=1 Tax=Pseudobacter sp. TaxID=2045420 RepID=UPI003F7F16C3
MQPAQNQRDEDDEAVKGKKKKPKKIEKRFGVEYETDYLCNPFKNSEFFQILVSKNGEKNLRNLLKNIW